MNYTNIRKCRVSADLIRENINILNEEDKSMSNQITNEENKCLIEPIYFDNEEELYTPIYFDNDGELYTPIYFHDNKENIEPIVFPPIQSQQDNFSERESNREKISSINDLGLSNNQNLYKRFDYITDNNTLNIITEEDKVVEICNFIIKPLSVIIKDDGLNKVTIYKMECILANNLDSKTVTLLPKELNNSEWIKSKLGIKYYVTGNVEEYKKLEMFIANEFKIIQSEVEYHMIGWRNIEDKWVYLHGSGAIGLDFNKNIYGSKDKIINRLNISQNEAMKQSLGLLTISNDLSKTLPMFLFSHLAVIKELFVQAGIEPKFCLWIYGSTGSMKTSVSKVFFNIFTNNINITATFKDTIAAIEMKSFEYKDSVLLVDDFHPTTSTSEKREMEKLASDILRRYGDGICKSRATKYMTKQNQFPPRGLCVITGEDVIGGESTVARYISIEVRPGDFKSQELACFQNNPYIFSTHIYYFIEWISNNFIALKEHINEKIIKVRNENLSNFRHGRMNEAFAIFSVTIDIVLNYFMQCSFIDETEKEIKSIEWKKLIFNTIKTHENSNVQQSPEIMYLIAIKELVGSGKLYLADINDNKSKKDSEKTFGYQSEEKIYLIPKIVYAEVKSFWKSQGIEFPVSDQIINKMLDELGIIEVKVEEGKKRRSIKISGDNRRFLVINKAKMEAILERID